MEKETEIMNKLAELIQIIDEERKIDAETVAEVFDTVFALNAKRKNKSQEDEFLCPLSKKPMTDPVVIASGQTYDRSSLVNWQKSERKTSPRTNKVLPHGTIAPNHLVHALILKWCKSHGVPETVQHGVVEKTTSSDGTLFTVTVNKICSARDLPSLKLAVKELLQLTRERSVFQALFAKYPDVIQGLLKMLPPPKNDYEIDPQLHEDVTTILLNLSADEKNKLAVSMCPMIIPFLIQALKAKKLEIRCNAAATIHQMSFIYTYKELIRKSGVLKLLIELLKEKWSLQATRDAMNAMSSVCENKENVGRAVRLGAVTVVAEKVVKKTFADELLPMLKLFSDSKQALKELESFECVTMLLSIVRENPSDASKENAILILYNVFENNRRFWVEMIMEIEQNRGTITQISQNGNPNARIKANAILESLNKETVTSTATSSSITP